MVAVIDVISEWIPEQMGPGSVFVLENAGRVGEVRVTEFRVPVFALEFIS